ncbi:hypothetical protein SAMN04488104_102430 [Algoriphagus faecimaris]|uniref:Outer membrane protein beta-barrel domain-containing protein n=1 Tax=Algoriphagus faecimaris TaxID=686796 RepID=A0A1G6TTY6_9BACT|nr:hypothetical protein [Algoriphagus faecimaris]SDD32563.1 hypothetical protein SAMN04488104_102430 [Algoriphagus faecimaris]
MKKILLSGAVLFLLFGENLAQTVSEKLTEDCNYDYQKVTKEDNSVQPWQFKEGFQRDESYLPSSEIVLAERFELPAGPSGYTTAIGVRGGYTSGVTFKHFVNNKAAIEVILGASRWRGTSLTGIYEWHKKGALEVSELSWVYGFGARVGFFDGRDYYDGYKGSCNDPRNPKCAAYWDGRSFAAIGLVGIGGLEYKFRDAPLTIGLDLIPYFYLQHYRGNFIDGSLSVRYTW